MLVSTEKTLTRFEHVAKPEWDSSPYSTLEDSEENRAIESLESKHKGIN